MVLNFVPVILFSLKDIEKLFIHLLLFSFSPSFNFFFSWVTYIFIYICSFICPFCFAFFCTNILSHLSFAVFSFLIKLLSFNCTSLCFSFFIFIYLIFLLHFLLIILSLSFFELLLYWSKWPCLSALHMHAAPVLYSRLSCLSEFCMIQANYCRSPSSLYRTLLYTPRLVMIELFDILHSPLSSMNEDKHGF